jgi:hypothetical protein
MTLPYKLLAYGVVLAALVIGYFSWRTHERGVGADTEREVWVAKLDKQKTEAAAILLTAQDEATNARGLLKANIEALGKQREQLQAENTASLRSYAATHRLQYTTKGSGSSCNAAKGGAPSSASDTDTTTVQLPSKISDDLYQLAADAQSLSIDYSILYTYVNNPKLVCQLNEGLK